MTLSAATLVLAGPAGAASFAPAQTYTTAGPSGGGDQPAGVALGDLDGDGHSDAVVAGSGSNDVAVLRGDGAGGLLAPQHHDVGGVDTNPSAVAVGDVNGDGRADVVTANAGTAEVAVLLGDGTGGLGPATRRSTGAGSILPVSVAIGDLDGDGNADLVTANRLSHDVSVLLGSGGGAFEPAQRHPAGPQGASPGPSAVVLADLDGDGALDVATANQQGTVSVMRGAGDGDLSPPQLQLVNGDEPGALAAGDLDADGMQDIVTANAATHAASVLLGAGGGALEPGTAHPVLGEEPRAVAIGDVDRDARPDVVTANAASSDVSVLLGAGDGGLGQPGIHATGAGMAGRGPVGLALGELDSDGRIDVVSANAVSDDVTVLRNLTASGFVADPGALDFGSVAVGSVRTLSVAIVNPFAATGPLALESVAVAGPGAGHFSVAGGCDAPMAPGDTCELEVTFAPADGGLAAARLEIETNVPGGERQSVELAGAGLAPGFAVTPATGDFGAVAVGSAGRLTLEVRNPSTAGAALEVGAVGIPDPGPFTVTHDGCGGRALVPGDFCIVDLAFAPRVAGPAHAQLAVPTNLPGGATQQVHLSGTGFTPGPPPPSSITFPPPPSPQTPTRPQAPPAATATVSGAANVNVTRSGRVRLRVRCAGASGRRCTGDLTLTERGASRSRARRTAGRAAGRAAGRGERATRRLGRAAVSVPAGRTRTVSIRLNATGRRIVSARARVRAHATLRAPRGAAGRRRALVLVAARAPRVSILTGRTRSTARGRVRVALRCARGRGRCSGRLVLRDRGGRALAAARIRIPAGARRALRLRLSGSARKRTGPMRLRAHATTRVPVGRPTTARRGIVVAGARGLRLTG